MLSLSKRRRLDRQSKSSCPKNELGCTATLNAHSTQPGFNPGNQAHRPIGLVAGWGRFPVLVASALIEQGLEVHCLAVRGHTDPVLREMCHSFKSFGIGRSGAQMRYLRRCGCEQATMAGKIFKTKLFERLAWIRHLPDLTFIRHFYPVLSLQKDRRDDTLLTIVTRMFASNGITFLPATDFAPELLVNEGILTRTRPTSAQLKDIEFGWKMAKQMGGLDIGQSVAVKSCAVLAVEAIEGTDECIRRAGTLCTAGGFTVVKVAKPGQDMRFDVPTVGVGTIETIHVSGGKVLAIEAGKTILLDHEQTVETANRLGIAIVARTMDIPVRQRTPENT